MRYPWAQIAALGTIAVICGSVAIFDIPTLEELGRRRQPREPLSQDELERLGAFRAMIEYCNIAIEERAEVFTFSTRLSFNPAQKEALAEAKQSFKGADCDKLARRFPETYRRIFF